MRLRHDPFAPLAMDDLLDVIGYDWVRDDEDLEYDDDYPEFYNECEDK